ncbi:MAG: amidohydrolase family protein [Krumholzibacteria bacterium]|nr:amidohydrolase family protein [Candidatus Krumholzibacteria bacterium]
MDGPAITDGVVVVTDGRIAAVGPAATVAIPAGYRVLEAAVVTPGLIDAHATVGLSGIFNVPADQDMLDRAGPVQPELRAVDAYNPDDELVAWLRSLGVTTVHTGHAPGLPVSGQTMIVKTRGRTVAEALVREAVAVAATLAPAIGPEGVAAPSRAKTVALLRQELIRAREYAAELAATGGDGPPPARDLRAETMVRVLDGELALMVTAHRVRDITNALRLAEEFGLRLWLDGAAEAHQLLPQIKAAGVPVLLHPTMTRAFGETENLSLATAAQLADAGIPFALQSGYESYVPKTRVVLFEAAVAAGHGLGFARALAAVTRDAAQLLGIADRVGTLAVGKDGDLALFDGDPFEYTSHCTGVVIEGEVVSQLVR